MKGSISGEKGELKIPPLKLNLYGSLLTIGINRINRMYWMNKFLFKRVINAIRCAISASIHDSLKKSEIIADGIYLSIPINLNYFTLDDLSQTTI